MTNITWTRINRKDEALALANNKLEINTLCADFHIIAVTTIASTVYMRLYI